MHIEQIDIVKGLAILAVILTHATQSLQKPLALFALTIEQQIPIFFILIGIGIAISFRNGVDITRYVRHKIPRIAIPTLIVFLAALIIALYDGFITITPLWAVGIMPTNAAGNYFICVLLQVIVLAPLMYWVFQRWPIPLVAGCIAVNILFEVYSAAIPPDLYAYCFLRFVGYVAAGLWISSMVLRGEIHVPWWFLPVAAASACRVMLSGTNMVYSIGYTAVLALALLSFDYGQSVVSKIVQEFGRASYHIFLVQMLYIPRTEHWVAGFGSVALAFLFCCGAGWLFYRVTTVRRSVRMFQGVPV